MRVCANSLNSGYIFDFSDLWGYCIHSNLFKLYTNALDYTYHSNISYLNYQYILDLSHPIKILIYQTYHNYHWARRSNKNTKNNYHTYYTGHTGHMEILELLNILLRFVYSMDFVFLISKLAVNDYYRDRRSYNCLIFYRYSYSFVFKYYSCFLIYSYFVRIYFSSSRIFNWGIDKIYEVDGRVSEFVDNILPMMLRRLQEYLPGNG